MGQIGLVHASIMANRITTAFFHSKAIDGECTVRCSDWLQILNDRVTGVSWRPEVARWRHVPNVPRLSRSWVNCIDEIRVTQDVYLNCFVLNGLSKQVVLMS